MHCTYSKYCTLIYPNTVEETYQLPRYDLTAREQSLAGCGGDAGFGDEDVEFVVEVAGHRTSVRKIYRILQETLLLPLAT